MKTFDEPLADLSQQEQKLRRDDETIRQEKVKYTSSMCTCYIMSLFMAE